MSTRADADRGAHVLIPVKRLARAKSRLAPRLEPIERKLLALAMLEDTLRAASASPLVGRITVVTPDESAASRARGLGVDVLSESTLLPSAPPGVRRHPHHPHNPLNAALDAASRRVRVEYSPSTLVVLQADLPALRPQELTTAIALAAGGRAIVADHSGTGTTTLIVPGEGEDLCPRFGPWSAREHQRGGARALTGDWPGLRSDVDTPEDLRRVHLLGVGSATAALLEALDESDWHTA